MQSRGTSRCQGRKARLDLESGRNRFIFFDNPAGDALSVRWTSTVALDIGGRDQQEDSAVAFVSDDGGTALAVVADGLGGHGSGELASQAATDRAARLWSARGPNIGAARDFVEQANDAVRAVQVQRGIDSRSTVCCVIARDDEIEIASLGDSRAYLLANGKLERLTRDHSVTEMLLASGEISEDAMRGHPDSSRLTQSLGTEDSLRPFIVERLRVKAGQAILVCSDGLWQALPADEIAAALGSGADGLAGAVRRAAAAAGKDGDNISAVLLQAQGKKAGRRRGGGLMSWFRE